MSRKLSAEQVADLIQIPLKQWPGNCYGIADAVIKAGFIRNAKLRYGHWHGFIHPDSPGFGGRKFTHHAWIQSGSGRIVDPTRWVFENVEPYIYSGPAVDPDYDFGGNRLRMEMMKPAPRFVATQECHTLPESIKPFAQLMIDTERNEVSLAQIMWLANLPLAILEDKAEVVFKWIAKDVGVPGFIPMDNRLEVLGK